MRISTAVLVLAIGQTVHAFGKKKSAKSISQTVPLCSFHAFCVENSRSNTFNSSSTFVDIASEGKRPFRGYRSEEIPAHDGAERGCCVGSCPGTSKLSPDTILASLLALNFMKESESSESLCFFGQQCDLKNFST
jgi:hypothetical protein